MGNSSSRRKATRAREDQIRAKSGHVARGDSQPRFVADVMLGRLSKWLRIAGFDVLYSNRFSDDELVALSRREHRVLLSRDTRLLVRKVVDLFVFLESENIQEQIRQIFRVTNTTSLPGLLTRCLTCNAVLQDVERESVRTSVPSFVFETQNRFKRCPRCDKIYWAGTHRQAVLRRLETLLDDKNRDARDPD
jgi:uncharacterized protein